MLSPFAKIDGLYFDPEDEPSNFYYNLVQDLKDKHEKNHENYIYFEYDNEKDFYDALVNLQKFTDDNISVYGTSREGVYDVVINEDSDMDDQTKPQTVALRKKKKQTEEVIEN